MKARIIRLIKVSLRSVGLGNLLVRPRIPHGPEGIRSAGHRRYIGGMWEEIGQLQFDFLKSRGLKPDHVFCDVACGSLRAGVHLIPYLEPGNYLGIDKEQDLIDAGVEKELTPALVLEKKTGIRRFFLLRIRAFFKKSADSDCPISIHASATQSDSALL